MGVTGLWRLIEPAGKPVPVETLENKVLAVDISIWLHQMVKGYQDAKGAPLPNAHLIGLFQRLCKLLYFRIKPIFVFDGGFPDLKKETIAKRQDSKSKYQSESERIKRELALLLTKKTAISTLIGKQISPKKGNPEQRDDDIFKLPALPEKEDVSESESDDELNSSGSTVDLHTVDVESNTFKSLPAKEKYDLLMELKETRKLNSWGRLHELPQQSDNFSDFQMQRLLKRRKIQECIEDTEKEMGDCGMSLNELESLLNEEGIDTRLDDLPTRRIASNNTTRFLLIKDVKKAIENAKRKEEDAKRKEEDAKRKEEDATRKEKNNKEKDGNVINEIEPNEAPNSTKRDELEEDLDKAIKMSMECFENPDSSDNITKTDDSWTSCLSDNDYSDSESEEIEQPDMSSAKAYIMQYSDLTNKTINKLLTNKTKLKPNNPNLDQILNDLQKEKSIIIDKLELSSDDDEIKNIINIQHIKEENESDASSDSVMSVNNCEEEIINLDTTTDKLSDNEKHFDPDSINLYTTTVKIPDGEKYVDSNFDTTTDKISNDEKHVEPDSDEDDFEEVPEDVKTDKPVVELTLNMGDSVDDDIFADVFESRVTSAENLITENASVMETKDEAEINKEESKASGMEIISDKITKSCSEESLPTTNQLESPKPVSLTHKTNTIKSFSHNSQQPVEMLIKNSHVSKNVSSINIKSSSVQETLIGNECIFPNSISNEIEINRSEQLNQIDRTKISDENLNSIVEEIEHDEDDLLQEKGRLDRIGRNITEQMTKEAQDLLQLFGIPYIVAPMEAEAQCAFLESVNLTDGTITDDSDIWLFGGRTVYKNFFNQKKHVLQFIAERIEKSYNLNREQLILLALLVGSDYTTGITGVGPVTAMEILSSFPFNKKQYVSETSNLEKYTKFIAGLQEFKQWVRAGKRTDNTTLKKKLKNVVLTDDFPSVRVVQAYMEPNIDKNKEKFSWGKLDITLVRDYAKSKFGWSQSKLDEIIKPVIKRLQERKTQKTVHDYFQRKTEFQSLDDQMSKRVKAAVKKMNPNELTLDMTSERHPEIVKKRKSNKKSESTKDTEAIPGPSKTKRKRNIEKDIILNQGVKVISTENHSIASSLDIIIPKTDRVQDIIPQREKDKHSMLQNKLKAIEVFRKNRVDPKRRVLRKKPVKPKEKANLSASDSD